jgi:hypothetical protein
MLSSDLQEPPMEKKRVLPVINQASDDVAAGVGRRRVLQGLFAGVALPGVAESHPMHEHAQTSSAVPRVSDKAIQQTALISSS